MSPDIEQAAPIPTPEGPPEQLDPTGVRVDQTGEEAHRRGLPSAVRPKEPVDDARRNREVQPVEGSARPVALRESAGRERVVDGSGHRVIVAPCCGSSRTRRKLSCLALQRGPGGSSSEAPGPVRRRPSATVSVVASLAPRFRGPCRPVRPRARRHALGRASTRRGPGPPSPGEQSALGSRPTAPPWPTLGCRGRGHRRVSRPHVHRGRARSGASGRRPRAPAEALPVRSRRHRSRATRPLRPRPPAPAAAPPGRRAPR